MSDDSISYGEDKENLLYISKKINVDEFGLSEDGPFRESLSMGPSDVSVNPIGSELTILEGIHSIPQIFSDIQVARKFKPFSLKWSFGINANVGLINLTTESRKELFFSSAHSAIVYKYCTREMRHLEGHQSVINCISSDSNGDWLVTSDGDADGCLIVWSSRDLSPIYTLFSVYPDSGILLMALSPCARYLITIGEACDYFAVYFWLWTFGEQTPNDSFQVSNTNGAPVRICFHPDTEEHIMLVFEKQVFLIVWDEANKKLVSSGIPHISSKNKVGQLTCGTYMQNSHECFVSSSRGCILVFRSTLYGRNYEDGPLTNAKMFINAIKVSPASIGVITSSDGVLVVGDSRGHILFFDKRVKILYWLRNMSIGAITGLSFSISPKTYELQQAKVLVLGLGERRLDGDEGILDCDQYKDVEKQITKLIDAPFDATLDNHPFTIRDFFLSTADCNIYAFDFIHNVCTPIFQVADANVSSIDTHDEMPRLVIGYANGRVSLMDFEKKEQIADRLLPRGDEEVEGGDAVTCIRFSHESLHLVCGRANGEVWILEPVILAPKMPTPFTCSQFSVENIDFCHNSLQFAYFDSNKTVYLFNYSPQEDCWSLRGKVRSHYDTINDLQFFCVGEDNASVLHSIGADRYLVEYNNLEMRRSEEVAFGITSRERIEQSAVPMNFTYYERRIASGSVGFLLLANDKHKIKTLHASTKVPRSLVLGPSFGCFKDSHIRKMRVLPQQHTRCMVFISEKHIGIQLLPADGNPYKYTGYLAHPKKVADFAVSHNELYAFTYGVEDRCILQWEIRTRSVELLSIIGGTELEPYYCLLEGGKSGWLFQEIQDLFFYMQILQQENIDLPRRVSDSINLTEIPDLVRTCGYYPSHFEMETMMIDIRYRDFDETGVVRDEISFVEFVKLFINHRPAYGYSLDRIREAFGTACQMAEYPRRSRIESHDFVYLLQTVGEPSPNLHRCLTTLLRITTHGENNYEFLPPEIDTSFLFYELLGIDPDSNEKRDYRRESDDSDANISTYF